MTKKIHNPPPPDNVVRPDPPPSPPRPPCWQDDIDEVKRLTAALGQKDAEIRRLKQEIKDFADYRALKREQIRRLSDALEQKAQRIKELERAIFYLTESLDEAKHSKPKLRSKLDKQRQRIKQFEVLLDRWLDADDWTLRDGFEISLATETREALGTAGESGKKPLSDRLEERGFTKRLDRVCGSPYCDKRFSTRDPMQMYCSEGCKPPGPPDPPPGGPLPRWGDDTEQPKPPRSVPDQGNDNG